MKTVENLKSAKRFGTRYGKKLKLIVAHIEAESRKLHKCPYCKYTKVKRISAGIWHCRKCHATFTGKAYSVEKKVTFEKGAAEIPVEQEKIGEENEADEKEETVA